MPLKATMVEGSGNREYPEEEDELRNCFQMDKQRIILSKAFRRLKHKTQVFWAPRNDYFRTRLSHTLEVSLVACTISRNLNLNFDLSEAIALGHDLGHPPFGHAGERVIKEYLKPLGKSFDHHLQSLRVVSETEDSYRELANLHFPGLNLCIEVRDGIKNHPLGWEEEPKTPEGLVVRYADVISYINHDYLDFDLYNITIPKELRDRYGSLGSCYRERIDKMIRSVIDTSRKKRCVVMPEWLINFCKEINGLTEELIFKANEEWIRREKGTKNIIEGLFNFFLEAPEDVLRDMVKKKIFSEKAMKRMQKEGDRLPTIIDHITGMTDNYAIEQYRRFISPETLEYYF